MTLGEYAIVDFPWAVRDSFVSHVVEFASYVMRNWHGVLGVYCVGVTRLAWRFSADDVLFKWFDEFLWENRSVLHRLAVTRDGFCSWIFFPSRIKDSDGVRFVGDTLLTLQLLESLWRSLVWKEWFSLELALAVASWGICVARV